MPPSCAHEHGTVVADIQHGYWEHENQLVQVSKVFRLEEQIGGLTIPHLLLHSPRRKIRNEETCCSEQCADDAKCNCDFGIC